MKREIRMPEKEMRMAVANHMNYWTAGYPSEGPRDICLCSKRIRNPPGIKRGVYPQKIDCVLDSFYVGTRPAIHQIVSSPFTGSKVKSLVS